MSGPADNAPAPLSPRRAEAILQLLDRPVSAADLATGAELASHPADSAKARSTRLLLFKLGEETLALPPRLLQRVTPVAHARPIPRRSTGVLRGVCNIRGELVLCVDLRAMLRLPAAPAAVADGAHDHRRMVVIGPTGSPWAFEVDALIGIEAVDSTMVRRPPVTVEYALGAFASGVTEINGRCVTVLDGERVLEGFKGGLA